MEDSASSGASLKRRRGPAYITSNACVECKRKKAKCDGEMPCGRCATHGSECTYEISVRSSKEALREEIRDLKAQLQQSEETIRKLSALQSSGYASQEGTMMPLGNLSKELDSYLSTSDNLAAPGLSHAHYQGPVLRPSIEHTMAQNQFGVVDRWTDITSNQEFIEHLSTLYFRWEYPLFASVSKEHFLADFRAGRHRYCSPLLVNALLAVGCRFSDRPEARAGPGDTDSGSHFFAEAKRLLAQERGDSLTKIQALGLMSVREVACERDSEGWFYCRQAISIAVEMGLHTPLLAFSPEEQRVCTATFWGAFTLDQAWSLTVGRLPHFSLGSGPLPKPLNADNDQTSDWLWQTEYGVASEQPSQQSGDVRPTYDYVCTLSGIVHSSLYMLYNPTSSVNSTELLRVYTRYLEWHSYLPDALHKGGNPSPAALFIHMYYYYALLLLFRPFINLHILNSSVVPCDVCLRAAHNISSLVQSYKRLYTIRNTPAFVPYVTLASTIVYLIATDSIILSSGGSAQVQQGASDLQGMLPCNPFARRAVCILKILARYWGIAVSLDGPIDMNDTEQLCHPSTGSMNFFCPNQEGFLLRGVQDCENSPVFTPFPMQGLPTISMDEVSLRDSGFSLRKSQH